MLKDIICLIKNNIGKCENCDKRFIAWEYNWDGALELNLCKDCTLEKRAKKEKEYVEKFEKAQKIGKEVLTATGILVGWTHYGNFYENPDFVARYDPTIDDIIRQERRRGTKEILWEADKFAKLQEYVSMCGWVQVWDEKEFDFMGVHHKLKI